MADKKLTSPESITCPICYGSKKVADQECDFCQGAGELRRKVEHSETFPQYWKGPLIDGLWTGYGPGATDTLFAPRQKKGFKK